MLQEYTVQDVLDALRLALRSVPQEAVHAEEVVDSPTSLPSTVAEEGEEEDAVSDCPGGEPAAKGVVCTHHVWSISA